MAVSTVAASMANEEDSLVKVYKGVKDAKKSNRRDGALASITRRPILASARSIVEQREHSNTRISSCCSVLGENRGDQSGS